MLILTQLDGAFSNMRPQRSRKTQALYGYG